MWLLGSLKVCLCNSLLVKGMRCYLLPVIIAWTCHRWSKLRLLFSFCCCFFNGSPYYNYFRQTNRWEGLTDRGEGWFWLDWLQMTWPADAEKQFDRGVLFVRGVLFGVLAWENRLEQGLGKVVVHCHSILQLNLIVTNYSSLHASRARVSLRLNYASLRHKEAAQLKGPIGSSCVLLQQSKVEMVRYFSAVYYSCGCWNVAFVSWSRFSTSW